MKKLFLVLVLGLALMAGTAFADFGIGVHGGYGGLGSGGGLNLAFSNVFIYIDAFGLGNNHMSISGAVDFVSLLNSPIVATLNWYIRLGIGVGLWGWDNNMGLAAAVRLPIGLSWKPIKLLEIFLQINPQIGLQIIPDVNLWGNFWGGNLGIRLWIG
ncbi:MAG: hypothetical protein FWC01_06380 [Treponema sp.]|nr:hypothetical protein [Treponema sp.]MCL2237464.1 hypothetical protein [Treponema sp.]